MITTNSGKFELRFNPDDTIVRIFDNEIQIEISFEFDEMCKKLFDLKFWKER